MDGRRFGRCRAASAARPEWGSKVQAGCACHADQSSVVVPPAFLVDRRAGRGLDGAGLAGHRPGRVAGRRRWPVSHAADGVGDGLAGGDVRRHASQLPASGPLELCGVSGFAGLVGGGLSVSADQRRATLDSLRSDRIAAVGVCQAGICAGPGPLPDASPQLSRVAGAARSDGDCRRPAGAGAQRAGPGNGAGLFAGAHDDAVCRWSAAATFARW